MSSPSTTIFQNSLIAQVSGNVGIGTDTPTRPLDVVGAINTSAAYQIGGTQVLSDSALGSSIVSSSLTSVGTLNSLVVSPTSGSMQLDDKTLVNFLRAIPDGNVLYNGVGICDIYGYGYSLELDIVQSEGAKNSFAKKYFVSSGTNSTNLDGAQSWKRLLPITASGVEGFADASDLAVDVRISFNVTTQSSQTQLRLVRSRVDNVIADMISENIQCSLVVCQNKLYPVTITPVTAAYVSPITFDDKLENIYCGTLIGVKHYRDRGNTGGVIGVGTDRPDPGLLMDINGPIRCWGSIFTEGRFSSAAGESSFPDIKVTGTANVTTLKCDSLEISNFAVGASDNSGTFRVVGNTSLDTSTGVFRSVASASDQSWSSVCYGNGRYVAVSDGATNPGVMTSMDGRVWVSQVAAPSTGAAWKSVAFGNGLYVAIAANGSIMRSANVSTWTIARTDTTRSMTSIAFGNNVFVAVGGDNNVLVGDNTATNWVLNTGIANQAWQSIAFGATQFVAVASTGVNIRVATSPNGTTWTSRFSAADLAWKTVSYGDGVFVALADSGTGRIMTSADDGLTWSLRTNPVALAWTGVAYGAGRWLAVASDGSGTRAMTSVDGGVTWSIRAASADLTWRAIAYGGFEFAAVASSGTANRAMVWQADDVIKALAVDGSTSHLTIAAPNVSVVAGSTVVQGNVTVQKVASTSSDMTWTTRTSPSTNQWQAVTYGNNLFVAVASSGNVNRIATSEDGLQWTSQKSPVDNNNWAAVAYGNLTYVAVSTTGSDCVMKSSNGKDWTLRSSANDNLLWRGVAYGNGRFVGVSNAATSQNVMYSTDNGESWILVNTGISVGWFRIAFGNGVFVVTSNATSFATSPDGVVWTSRTLSITNPRGITFGGGLFVIVCLTTGTPPNRLFTSPDGVTWTGYTIENNTWTSVTYGDGLFVAVASTGTNRVVTSSDGINWTARPASAALAWSTVAYGNGVFAALANDATVGLYDRIMTSPGISDTVTTSPLLVVDTVSGSVGIGTASPAFALDVSGTVNAGGIRTGTITAPGNGLSLNPGGLLDSTTLIQGSVLGWNSEVGSGRTDLVNKSGTGAGGFNFWNSTGSGSTFVTGRNLLAQIAPGLVIVPNDLYCANSVGTSSSTAGNRFYYRQLAQPCFWTTTFTVTSQNSTSFFLDVALTNPPFCQDSTSTVVNACNGDPANNPDFYIYNAYLWVLPSTTSVPPNSQPTRVRLFCKGLNTNTARVNVQISFYPV